MPASAHAAPPLLCAGNVVQHTKLRYCGSALPFRFPLFLFTHFTVKCVLLGLAFSIHFSPPCTTIDYILCMSLQRTPSFSLSLYCSHTRSLHAALLITVGRRALHGIVRQTEIPLAGNTSSVDTFPAASAALVAGRAEVDWDPPTSVPDVVDTNQVICECNLLVAVTRKFGDNDDDEGSRGEHTNPAAAIAAHLDTALLQRLRTLDLRGCALSSLEGLEASTLPHLQSLDVSCNLLNSLAALASFLTTAPSSLTSLNVSDNTFRDDLQAFACRSPLRARARARALTPTRDVRGGRQRNSERERNSNAERESERDEEKSEHYDLQNVQTLVLETLVMNNMGACSWDLIFSFVLGACVESWKMLCVLSCVVLQDVLQCVALCCSRLFEVRA